jgi:PAS domain S-box-containing protein
VAAFLVLLVGVTVLTGWTFDVPGMKRLVPGWSTMVPASALGLSLGAMAVIFLGATRTSDRHYGVFRALGLLCAGAMVAVGGEKLAEPSIGRNLLPDLLFFRDAPIGAPGSMAPATATSLVLLGIALGLASQVKLSRIQSRLFQVLTVVAASIGWLGVCRQVYGGPPLFAITPMTIHAAACVALLAVAIWCLRPDAGLLALLTSAGGGGVLARRLLPAAIFIPLAVGWLQLWADANGWVTMEAGIALFALSVAVMFAAQIWFQAAQLQQVESRREAAEGELAGSLNKIVDLQAALDEQYMAIRAEIAAGKQAEEKLWIKQQHSQSLLRLSQKLECAATREDVLRFSREEVQWTLGFNVVWFYQFSDDRKFLRLVTSDDAVEGRSHSEHGKLLEIAGDRMLEEIAAGREMVVVEDARTDPRTNKALVETMGNRTIVNVPITLADKNLGTIGTGTFGDEGVRKLNTGEREFFATLASHAAAALDRILAMEHRHQAEQTLAEERNLLRTLIDSMPDVVFTKDLQGRFGISNRAHLRLTGAKDESELAGKTVFDIHPHELAEGYHQDDLQVIKSGEPILNREEPCVNHENKNRWYLTIKVPLHNQANERIGLVGMSRDITEQREAERARERQRRRTAMLAEVSRRLVLRAPQGELIEGIFSDVAEELGVECYLNYMVKADGNGLQLSRSGGLTADDRAMCLHLAFGEALCGWVADQRERLVLGDLQFSDWPNAAQARMMRFTAYAGHPLMAGGRLFGTIAFATRRRRAFEDEDLRLMSAVANQVAAAIERGRADEKVRTLNAELEQRVAERTTELEAANHELEAFSYSVSHDLRAPLRAVDGFSQAVLEDYGPILPEDGHRLLKIIREGAQKMGRLIDDLLTFSRLSRVEIKMREFDTNALVNDVLEEMRPEQEGRRINLQIGTLPPSHGDPSLIKQVWVNLISNAFKYTRKREEAVIEIGFREEDGAGAYFVKDNGSGFDMRYAHKLFGVFQRLHRAEDFEGTGVGLAIVQRVVARHGGRIWANAKVDAGATFCFTIKEVPKL